MKVVDCSSKELQSHLKNSEKYMKICWENLEKSEQFWVGEKWETWLIYPGLLTLPRYSYLKDSFLLLRGDRLTVCWWGLSLCYRFQADPDRYASMRSCARIPRWNRRYPPMGLPSYGWPAIVKLSWVLLYLALLKSEIVLSTLNYLIWLRPIFHKLG